MDEAEEGVRAHRTTHPAEIRVTTREGTDERNDTGTERPARARPPHTQSLRQPLTPFAARSTPCPAGHLGAQAGARIECTSAKLPLTTRGDRARACGTRSSSWTRAVRLAPA